jgi:hypothetical protein
MPFQKRFAGIRWIASFLYICPTMRSFWAILISIIGHPSLVLTYILLLMLSTDPYMFGTNELGEKRSMLLLISVIGITFFIPGIAVMLMRPLGLIKSLSMEDKQERIGPYIITGVFYLWLYKNLLSGGGHTPSLFACFVLGATIGLFLAFFCNIFTKISAHATGMGGFVTMLLMLCLYWRGKELNLGGLHISMVAVLGAGIILAGLVGAARLALAAHTPKELLQGYAAGATAVLLASALHG